MIFTCRRLIFTRKTIKSMDKKLTLSLDERVIEKAKVYAKQHQVSLSRLIEAYLSALIDNKPKDIEITPLVKSLSGVVEIPDGFDHRSEYADYLMEKYR